MKDYAPTNFRDLLESTKAVVGIPPEIQKILESMDPDVVADIHAWVSQEVTEDQVRAVMWAIAQNLDIAIPVLRGMFKEYKDELEDVDR
jgi:hypothetical protein